MASLAFSRRHVAFLSALLLISAFTGLARASDSFGGGAPQPAQQQPASSTADRVKNRVEALELGKALERNIRGGDTHLYSVILTSGQFMHVVVDQRGVDVVVLLSDPGGRELLRVDYPNGTNGPQSVSFVADAPGTYLLKVKKLIKSSPDGQYEIKLTELREATAQDRRRVEADRDLIDGSRLMEKGDKSSLEAALKEFTAAHDFFKDYDDAYQDALSVYMIGSVFDQVENTEDALGFYEQARSLFAIARDRAGQALSLNAMGETYFLQGRNDQAAEALSKALELYRSAGDQADEVSALIDLGGLYFSMGDKKTALKYYKQALPISVKVRYDSRNASALAHLADFYAESDDPTQALRLDEEALTYYTRAKDLRGIASVLDRIGRIYYALGESDKTLQYYNRSLELSRKGGDRNEESTTLNYLAWIHFKMGERHRAFEQLLEALAVSHEAKSQRIEANILANIMAVCKELNNRDLAIYYGKRAVNMFQDIRSQSQGLDKGLQKSFLKSYENLYRTLAELLVASGRLDEAQQILDMLKEDEYFQYLRRQSKTAFAHAAVTGEEASLAKSEAAGEGRITAIAREMEELVAKGDLTAEEKGRLDELKTQLDVEQKAYDKTLEELRRRPGKTEGGDGDTTLAKVQITESLRSTLRDLGRGTVVLYTIEGETKYTVLLFTADVAVSREYKIKAADLNQKIMAFRQVLQDPTKDPRPLAQELYKIIVGPVASNLKAINAKTLVWAFDGLLRYVPVAALYDGEKYMVERYQNVVVTPASYARLKDRDSQREWRALGLGVTKAIGNYPALPGVQEELKGIIRRDGDIDVATGVMPGVILIDDTFTEEKMKQALQKKFRVVHIASHFDFEPGDNQRSLLLGDGKYLSVSDIASTSNIFDGVELLTLSACNTAMGETDASGAELENFAVLAQNKGAKAVAATLWSVADSSTSLLMRKFYQLLEENQWMPKSEALRKAQLSLLYGEDAVNSPAEVQRSTVVGVKEQNGAITGSFNTNPKAPYAHPYYWAPFILIGNWQ